MWLLAVACGNFTLSIACVTLRAESCFTNDCLLPVYLQVMT